MDDTTTRPVGAHGLAYQPALDGIRGIAVAGVLFFHGGHLTGGYLGVDAFFVLSGFLITSLLLHEIAATGTVALAAFWGRRLRRLLPALLLVLLAVAVYAATSASATQLDDIRGDALATLGYVANWRQVFTGQDYWALFGSPSPLQHTWSLAIEEQFYLLWPIALLLLNRRHPDAAARRTLALALGLAAGSFLLMQVLAHPDDISRVYYGTDTRAASILIGAALASWSTRPRFTTPTTRRGLEVGAVLGILVLAVTWARLDGGSMTLVRGGLLISAVATAVVIAAAVHPERGPVSAALSFRPFRILGVVSYGVYLWHWPIYVLLDGNRTGWSGWSLFGLRIAVTFAVAAASYVLVERPIRYAPAHAYRALRRLAPAAAAVVVVAVVAATVPAATPPIQAARGGNTVAARVLFAGDSVALTLTRDNRDFARAMGLDLGFAGRIGCGLTAGERLIGSSYVPPAAACRRWPSTFAAKVRERRPQVAVLAVSVWEVFDVRDGGRAIPFDSPLSRRRLIANLDRARTVLTADGAQLALLTASCYRPSLRISAINDILGETRRVNRFNAQLRRYAAAHSDVTLIDLHGHLCPKGRYRATIGSDLVRYDGVHFTPEGARAVLRWLAPQLRGLA